MTIQHAIELAIEGGYKGVEPDDVPLFSKVGMFSNGTYLTQSAVLDPQFWQCLGKALGWKETSSLRFGSVIIEAECKMWVFYWHRMIDHIADGKDLTSFFETLE